MIFKTIKMHPTIVYRLLIMGLFLSIFNQAHSQVDSALVKTDTVEVVPILFSPSSASTYLQKLIKKDNLWRDDSPEIKQSLSKLIHHFNEPFDSVSTRLKRFPYDSVKLKPTSIVHKDSYPIRWLNKSLFIVDTIPLDKNPVISQKTVVMRVVDPSSVPFKDSIPGMKTHVESLLQVKDTIVETFIDSTYLKSKRIQIYRLTEDEVVPSLIKPESRKVAKFSSDSSKIIISKTTKELVANKESPFYIVPNEKMTDSLRIAVETLLSYTVERDSLLINFSDIAGRKTPMWLSTGKEDLYRYWVKNSKNDSITIWIGNPSRSNITLALEEEVNVERLERKKVDDVPISSARANRILVKIDPLKEIPIYWKSELASSFALNGNYLSKYWARGGETTISSLLDVNGKTEYNNKEAKTKWVTTGRLRYGTTWTEIQKFRTNTDIIEINSQYNKVIMDRLDFSSSFYMKTQSAKGYNYPNDSIPVSKFLNPGTFTIGVGLEFKPNKETAINFSPLSYRNTFVMDTLNIDQTAHGIEVNKKVRNEMGGQLVINNSTTILKDMKIINTVRLFSNYLKKPQNVDVNWEMGLEKQISWYFKIRLNMQLIYDDDVLFPLFEDRRKQKPILNQEGKPVMAPKTQFSQFMGLTLAFKI